MELFKKLDWKIPIVNHAQWVAERFRDGYIFSSQWFCLLQIVFGFNYTVKCSMGNFPVVNIVVLKVIFMDTIFIYIKKRFFSIFEFKTEIKMNIWLKTYSWWVLIIQNDKCWWTSETFSFQFETLYSIISIWSKTFDTGALVISFK